jgi:hypothetical protein
MFRSLFTHIGCCFPGRAARRAVTRAASLAAITVLMLGTLSGPAVAQATNTPLRAFFTKLTCLDESNDDTWPFPDHDEIYLVIFAVDLRGRAAEERIFLEGCGEMDTGETSEHQLQIWSLNGDGTGSPIASDDDYIILAQLMEFDDRGADVSGKVYHTLSLKLRAYKQAGMSRATMASFLRTDMDTAIEASRGGDDRVGPVFEIVWGTEWLPVARSGQTVTRSALLVSADSKYGLEFQLRP